MRECKARSRGLGAGLVPKNVYIYLSICYLIIDLSSQLYLLSHGLSAISPIPLISIEFYTKMCNPTYTKSFLSPISGP